MMYSRSRKDDVVMITYGQPIGVPDFSEYKKKKGGKN